MPLHPTFVNALSQQRYDSREMGGSIREKDFDILDENINQPSTYYIVDPGNTKDDCNPPVEFLGKVIIVTSPDDGHWGGTSFYERAGWRFRSIFVLPCV